MKDIIVVNMNKEIPEWRNKVVVKMKKRNLGINDDGSRMKIHFLPNGFKTFPENATVFSWMFFHYVVCFIIIFFLAQCEIFRVTYRHIFKFIHRIRMVTSIRNNLIVTNCVRIMKPNSNLKWNESFFLGGFPSKNSDNVWNIAKHKTPCEYIWGWFIMNTYMEYMELG